MMNNYKQPKKKIANTLEFGTVFEKAFDNYKKIVGIVGISFILMTIVYCILIFGLIGAIFGFSDFAQTMTAFNFTQYSAAFTVGYVIVVALAAGIMSTIYAGFYKMAHSAEINENYDLGTTFYYFKTKYFQELFLAGSLVSVITTSITFGLQYVSMDPLITLIASLLSYAIMFLTILASPLIIFSDLKAIDSLLMSVELVMKNFFIILGLLIVALILSSLGIIALCIGIFFTLPFIYSMIYSIYSGIFPFEEKINIIDEIGLNEEE